MARFRTRVAEVAKMRNNAVMEPKLLTTMQVAKRLGKSRRTVHRMASTGHLPVAHKLPHERGAYLFDAAAIDRMAAKR